jgi:hypothetical protein
MASRQMTRRDATTPARYQGAMKSGAHVEYSEGLAPSQTGDQYSEYETASGTLRPSSHFTGVAENRVHANARIAESTATTPAPDSSVSG